MPRGKNREQFLAAGLELLYKRGFNASGVQEIADASGVPKGSFYNYFKSKEDFAEQVVERYTQDLSAYLEQTLLQAEGSPLSRLRGMFESWSEKFATCSVCGCLTGNLAQELAIHNPMIQKVLERSFNRLQSYYIACLEEAKVVGEIDQNADPKLLGAFIYNGWQGALLRAKAQNDMRAIQQFQKVVFEMLLPSKF